MRLNESINMNEGQIREICAFVDCDSCNEKLRERAIPISLSLMFSNETSGKHENTILN